MSDADEFAEAVVSFVRGFGLHRPERTPCGFNAGVAEAHALAELSGGALRQSELVLRLGLTKSTVSRLVDNLVDRDWAQRHTAEHDGRGVIVMLTPAGDDAAARLREARTHRMQLLLDAVPARRRQEAIELLELLGEAARVTDPRHA
ncbi:MAG: MarR family transcriptional regulator [Acidimicrobiia bacterium]|jgi:DNA-binding MarR family transcriptional regulator